MKITLAAARKNAGFTQEEAAKMLNINARTLHMYETMKSIPSVLMAEKMSQLYNTPSKNIIFFEQ